MGAPDGRPVDHLGRKARIVAATGDQGAAELQTFYVTFGGRESCGDHPAFPPAHTDGWLRLDAADELIARRFLAAWLGGRYSCIYPAGSEGDPRLYQIRDAGGAVIRPGYPRGELGRVVLEPVQGEPTLIDVRIAFEGYDFTTRP